MCTNKQEKILSQKDNKVRAKQKNEYGLGEDSILTVIRSADKLADLENIVCNCITNPRS